VRGPVPRAPTRAERRRKLAADLDLLDAVLGAEPPAVEQAVAPREAQAIMARKISGSRRYPARRKVRRSGADDSLRGRDLARDHGRIIRSADPKGDVESVRSDFEPRIGKRQMDFERERRMERREFGQEGSDPAPAQLHRRADPQEASGRHNAPIRAIAETLIVGAEDLLAEVRAATGGKGADVVFDLVGGVMFRSALKCLAWRGRLVEIAATGQREVSFDLADFYHNESRLFGVDTLKRDLTASAEVLDALAAGFVAGDYRAAPIEKTCGLGEAQEAYRKVAAGATGRIVLRPQD
jgi:Zinc-binding dehydrogenase